MTEPQVPTGLPALDRAIGGGFRRNRTYLMVGPPGSGKTSFALRYLQEGTRHGEPGIHLTLTERPAALREQAWALGWDLRALEDAGKLALLDGSGVMFPASSGSGAPEFKPASVDGLIDTVIKVQEEMKARRAVIDGLNGLFLRGQDMTGCVLDCLKMATTFEMLEMTTLATFETGWSIQWDGAWAPVAAMADGVLMTRRRRSRRVDGVGIFKWREVRGEGHGPRRRD